MKAIDKTWEPAADERVGPRLTCVLHTWEGTSCSDGVAVKGTRANCATFVWAFLVEMFRMKDVPEFVFPMADVHHSAGPSMAAMEKFCATFPVEIVDDEMVQPGDVMVAGYPNTGMAHLMVVGPQRNTVWHCTPSGVHMGGWVIPLGMVLKQTFRCDTARWFR